METKVSNRVDLAHEEVWFGIIIKVYKVKRSYSMITFAVHFFVENGSIENLNNVQAMDGFKSLIDAINAGKNFIQERQWKVECTKYTYQILVRQLYNDDWAYRIVDTFNDKVIHEEYNYKNRETALKSAQRYLDHHSE